MKLSAAPLVEGAVAAAAAAAGGATLEEVAAEARGALAMKASQISRRRRRSAGRRRRRRSAADATAELAVRNAIGLHARPAARFVETARRFDADVRVAKDGQGAPVRARQPHQSGGARRAVRGHVPWSRPRGRRPQAAVEALRELARGGFGDGVSASPPAPAAPDAPPAAVPRARGRRSRPLPGAVLTGVAASSGVAIGPAHRLGGLGGEAPPDREPRDAERGDPDAGRRRSPRRGARSSMTARSSPAGPARPTRRSSTPISPCYPTTRCSSRHGGDRLRRHRRARVL